MELLLTLLPAHTHDELTLPMFEGHREHCFGLGHHMEFCSVITDIRLCVAALTVTLPQIQLRVVDLLSLVLERHT